MRMRSVPLAVPLAALSLTLATELAGAAAVETPRVSPGAAVTQKVGTTEVTIRYHRPAVKGRTVWGELVPYDQVWRLGANEATTISFEHDVTVAGQSVPAGTYAFFAIPRRDGWTWILNRRAQQWGAFSYEQGQDQLRVEAKPTAAPATEWMTFTITPVDAGSAEVALQWEKLRVTLPVAVDVAAVVWRDLDAALATAGPGDGDLYLQAARYARDSGQRLDQALGWIDRSIAAGETWWNLETKAQLLHARGQTAEALRLAGRALELARGKTPEGYQQGLERQIAEYRAALPQG
jgi:hypothetical protein